MVCCATAQFLRGRQPGDSAHLERKLADIKTVVSASPQERRRIHAAGRPCAAVGCARREPYAGAFKTCGRCRAAQYCCASCQVSALCSLRCGTALTWRVSCSTPPQKTHWKKHKLTCCAPAAKA